MYAVALSEVSFPVLGRTGQKQPHAPQGRVLLPLVYKIVPTSTNVDAEPVYVSFQPGLSIPRPATYCCAAYSEDTILLAVQPAADPGIASLNAGLKFFVIKLSPSERIVLKIHRISIRPGYRGFSMANARPGIVVLHRFGTDSLIFFRIRDEVQGETLGFKIPKEVAKTALSPREKECLRRLGSNPSLISSSLISASRDGTDPGYFTSILFARRCRQTDGGPDPETIVVRIRVRDGAWVGDEGALSLSIVPPQESGEKVPLDPGVCVLFNRYALIAGGIQEEAIPNPATEILECPADKMMDPWDFDRLALRIKQKRFLLSPDVSSSVQASSEQLLDPPSPAEDELPDDDPADEEDSQYSEDFFSGWKSLAEELRKELDEVRAKADGPARSSEPEGGSLAGTDKETAKKEDPPAENPQPAERETSVAAANAKEDRQAREEFMARPPPVKAAVPRQQVLLLDLATLTYRPLPAFYREYRYMVRKGGDTESMPKLSDASAKNPPQETTRADSENQKEYRIANARSLQLSLPTDPAIENEAQQLEKFVPEMQKMDIELRKHEADIAKLTQAVASVLAEQGQAMVDEHTFVPIFTGELDTDKAGNAGNQAVRSFYRRSPVVALVHTNQGNPARPPAPLFRDKIAFLGGQARGATQDYQFAPGNSLSLPLDFALAVLSAGLGEDRVEECLRLGHERAYAHESRPQQRLLRRYDVYGDVPRVTQRQEGTAEKPADVGESERAMQWYKDRYEEKDRESDRRKKDVENKVRRIRAMQKRLERQQEARQKALSAFGHDKMLESRIQTVKSEIDGHNRSIEELEKSLEPKRITVRMRAAW